MVVCTTMHHTPEPRANPSVWRNISGRSLLFSLISTTNKRDKTNQRGTTEEREQQRRVHLADPHKEQAATLSDLLAVFLRLVQGGLTSKKRVVQGYWLRKAGATWPRPNEGGGGAGDV